MLSSAGGDGSDEHDDVFLDIIREPAGELEHVSWDLNVLATYSGLPRTLVRGRLVVVGLVTGCNVVMGSFRDPFLTPQMHEFLGGIKDWLSRVNVSISRPRDMFWHEDGSHDVFVVGEVLAHLLLEGIDSNRDRAGGSARETDARVNSIFSIATKRHNTRFTSPSNHEGHSTQ